MRQIFAWLFPFGPAANSILGTFYISSYVATYNYLSCSQFICLLGYPTLYLLLYQLRLKATPWTQWLHLLWVVLSCIPSLHSFRLCGLHHDPDLPLSATDKWLTFWCFSTPRPSFVHGWTSTSRRSFCDGRREAEYPNRVRSIALFQVQITISYLYAHIQ